MPDMKPVGDEPNEHTWQALASLMDRREGPLTRRERQQYDRMRRLRWIRDNDEGNVVVTAKGREAHRNRTQMRGWFRLALHGR